MRLLLTFIINLDQFYLSFLNFLSNELIRKILFYCFLDRNYSNRRLKNTAVPVIEQLDVCNTKFVKNILQKNPIKKRYCILSQFFRVATNNTVYVKSILCAFERILFRVFFMKKYLLLELLTSKYIKCILLTNVFYTQVIFDMDGKTSIKPKVVQ